MKTKLIAFFLLAGASAFAETRFSVQIGGFGGGYRPGYYAPPPVYYAPVRPHRFYDRRGDWYGRDRGFNGRFMYENRREFQGRGRDQWQDQNRGYYAPNNQDRDYGRNGSRR